MSSTATSVSMGRVLLVSADSAAIQQLSEGMQSFAIATEVCINVGMALSVLNRKKFEAVVVDFELLRADEILGQVRLSPSNRTAVTFAITDPARGARFETQPNFLIEKPLSTHSVGRTLKAAFGLIVRERRRSFRCPVQISATIVAMGVEAACELANISEGGMAITQSPALQPGTRVRVGFSLPGQRIRLTIEAEVSWLDAKRRAGLRSLMIPTEQLAILQEWLAGKLEEDLPESVARQFRKE